MRKGVNPEKLKGLLNRKFLHRVIIPVYIPNSSEDYYKESIEVFDTCLNSLFNTINIDITAVTIINNSSPFFRVDEVIDYYKSKGLIEKYVSYNDNKGKVHAVINEARSSFEKFITVADADVLFMNGWEKAVFDIFSNYLKAGVVSPSPSPHLALYKNSSIFFNQYLKGKIRYGKIIDDEVCDLFLYGMGNADLFNRPKHNFSWKEKHYYLDQPVKAVLGAGHFIATYRREILEFNSQFPEMKFKKGYEEFYLDDPSDKLGLYRLSTFKTYAYHIGNKMDDFSRNYGFTSKDIIDNNDIECIQNVQHSKIPFFIRNLIFRILYKILKL
tara:strand:+ start:13791 stop:14774 length:984 start_codon:yes stop_codon:yes gene_type:complete